MTMDPCPVNLELYGAPDLKYDFERSAALIALVQKAIERIDDQVGPRASAVEDAKTDFGGRYSRLFSASARVAKGDASELRARLEDVVRFLDRLNAAARAENARRKTGRGGRGRVEARGANEVDATWDKIFGEEPPPPVEPGDPPRFDPQ